jgi:predicted RNA-binding protein with PUA-like domain
MRRSNVARRKRYWLFKSEPEVFGIADLAAAPGARTFWEGVRNYQARNLLRDDVGVGDGVLFYHSRNEPIGVAGEARVVTAASPDPTQFDAQSKYHDEGASKDDPRWLGVEIEFVRAFDRVVPLSALKANPKLAAMMVTQRGARLSIQPVTPDEWRAVMAMVATSR